MSLAAKTLDFQETLAKAESEPINAAEALYLFQQTEDADKASQVFALACRVRDRAKGKVFHAAGGVARVLKCNLKPNCIFCPYWRVESQEPLSIAEILKAVTYIQAKGLKEFHLSGGTTLGSAGLDVLAIVEAIDRAGFRGMAIDVNCGAAMSLDTLKAIKSLGVKKVSAVFETLNPELFRKLKPGDDLTKKKAFASLIGEAGLELGTGILVGLDPSGDRYRNYVDFIFGVKQYPHLCSVYVSKFFPFKGIVLKDVAACSSQEALRVIAIMRLALPAINISPAQGWDKAEPIDPIQAGAGNKVGVVHIAREPKFKVTDAQKRHCKIVDGVEYFDYTDIAKAKLESFGLSLSF